MNYRSLLNPFVNNHDKTSRSTVVSYMDKRNVYSNIYFLIRNRRHGRVPASIFSVQTRFINSKNGIRNTCKNATISTRLSTMHFYKRMYAS